MLDTCEVVSQSLLHPTLALGLLLEFIQVLGQEIADGVRWFKFEWYYLSLPRNPEEHLAEDI